MTNIVESGYNLAMEILETFPPRYWKKEKYRNKQYLSKHVREKSNEFYDLEIDIHSAQFKYGIANFDYMVYVNRIQNPYTYSRFILRKKYLKNKYKFVQQTRKFKLIPYKYVDLALRYNCDSRRLGMKSADYVFYSSIPKIWDNYVLFVVQVLTTHDEDKDTECTRDSEFYIEYVVYYD